jgi:ribosome maturation factor RimP
VFRQPQTLHPQPMQDFNRLKGRQVRVKTEVCVRFSDVLVGDVDHAKRW